MDTRRYRWLQSLSNTMHKTHQKVLLFMVGVVCITGRIRSLAIADTIAAVSRVKSKSALQRFYRFVNGSKIDLLSVWGALTHGVLQRVGKMALISIDWTEWRFGLRALVATVAVGRRAIPVFAQSFSRDPPRSQNCRENVFIRVLQSFSPSGPESGVPV